MEQVHTSPYSICAQTDACWPFYRSLHILSAFKSEKKQQSTTRVAVANPQGVGDFLS